VKARTPPETATRERLLRSGQSLLKRHGLRGLTVRELAGHAKVNLGSFVYHFGTREAFNAELMERWYAPIWARLQLTADRALMPLERYRDQARCLAEWAAENRDAVGHLMLDVAARETAALGFLRTVAVRHPALMMTTIRDAQQAGQIVAGEPLEILAFTMAAVAFPMVLVQGIASRRRMPPGHVGPLAATIATPERIARRLQWAITGISVPDPKEERQ